MHIVIAVIAWLILAQFIDGRLAFVLVAIVLTGRVLLRHRNREQRRVTDDLQRLGISPQELSELSREEAIERLTIAQEEYRESLAAQGMDLQAFVPEVGRDIMWRDIVRQVFRVVDFDRADTIVGPGDTVKAASRVAPYGYLLVESPILNQPVNLPIVHRDDFLLATTVFDEPTSAKLLQEGELLVTYAPKRTLPDGRMAGPSHALHYVVTPRGTLDRYYDHANDVHMSSPAPEKLFGQFVYDGELCVRVNGEPGF